MMNNRRQNLSSSSSSQLMCVEGTWDDPQRKLVTIWGDPADLGVGKMNHAAHPHPLYQFKLEIHVETNCNICTSPIHGFAHGCEACDFFIHDDDCLNLKLQIHHRSHPAHPLHLRPPSFDRNTCDACNSPANTAFYRCGICDYDLHVDCAVLTERERELDGNLIRLYYSFPVGACVWCGKCNGGISRRDGWVWYDEDTGYTAHFKCGRPIVCNMMDYTCFLSHVMRYLLKRRNRKKMGRK
nr:probable nucleoredoxin 1-2 [Ipomoea batatas]